MRGESDEVLRLSVIADRLIAHELALQWAARC
jgi:hypothetical protein